MENSININGETYVKESYIMSLIESYKNIPLYNYHPTVITFNDDESEKAFAFFNYDSLLKRVGLYGEYAFVLFTEASKFYVYRVKDKRTLTGKLFKIDIICKSDGTISIQTNECSGFIQFAINISGTEKLFIKEDLFL